MAGKTSKNRAATAQAKAKERARKKARGTGTSIAKSAYIAPSTNEESTSASNAIEQLTDSPSPVSSKAPPSTYNRQTRQATAITVAAGGLKRELALIASMAVLVSALLAVLKLYTDLGS